MGAESGSYWEVIGFHSNNICRSYTTKWQKTVCQNVYVYICVVKDITSGAFWVFTSPPK